MEKITSKNTKRA